MGNQSADYRDSKIQRLLIISYYPVQIFLALLGIVLGFASWFLMELLGYEMLGKPDLHLYAIPLVLAIVLVRVHRYYVFRGRRNGEQVPSEKESIGPE